MVRGCGKKTQALETMAEAEKKVQEATHVSASFSRQRVETAEKLPILRQDEVEKAAEELRLASNNLGHIVGFIGVEEILGRIFKDFCIGK